MLKTQIKASGVTNLTDARYFAAWGIDWLGFDLSTEGLREVPARRVKEIKDWIEGPTVVAELGTDDFDTGRAIATELDMKAVQATQETPLTRVQSLRVPTILQEINVLPDWSAKDLSANLSSRFGLVNLFLLNMTEASDTWSNFKKERSLKDWKEVLQRYDCLVEMNGTTADWLEMLELLNPAGISLHGGHEEKVGYKSFDELDDLLEALEI